MRYHISSSINGFNSLDHCPFCWEYRDGHPDDIIEHMNNAHENGKFKLLTIRDGKNHINLACPESDFTTTVGVMGNDILHIQVSHSNEDESPDRNALGV
jgi:hypothetical protein